MFHCGYFCRLIQSNLKDEWKNSKKREKRKEQQAPSKKNEPLSATVYSKIYWKAIHGDCSPPDYSWKY